MTNRADDPLHSDLTQDWKQGLAPLAFILCAGWTVWRGPAYIMAFGGYTDALAARYPQISLIDYLTLIGVPVFAAIGMATVRRAAMEFEDLSRFDRLSVFIGRVTMLLVLLLVSVMMYEVTLRYVFESPTLWANELSLWMAGFVFILSGLYAMQQRSHIRIYLIYDLMPRGMQRACDTISTALIVLFAAALIYGGYGEAVAKFLRWETFGTVFDPPIPATLKPLILIAFVLVAVQAVLNLVRDWDKLPEHHAVSDEIDEDEIERIKRQVGGG
ncbi:MAG: TRAP transporter small permease [Alphaproteobacteria bacterium]|nr:TRAP transporter small permease [Alphaproteobacteria bacterium]